MLRLTERAVFKIVARNSNSYRNQGREVFDCFILGSLLYKVFFILPPTPSEGGGDWTQRILLNIVYWFTFGLVRLSERL
jgi:hypothetical protein